MIVNKAKMLANKVDSAPTKQVQIWEIAEERYGAELLCAVDNVNGTEDEHKIWMREVGIKRKNYYQLNVMIHFFALEADGALFYLRWGNR
jgi:hypothetical protein